MKKTIFITGASSGIGKETALYFLEKGWNVIATMRHPEERKTDLHDKGMTLLHLDVMDPSSVRAAVQTAAIKFGTIDVLLNNAGFAVRGVFEASTHDEVKKQYDTNVLGMMDVTREFIPILRKQKGGTIINIASIGGRASFPFYSIYNSSKFAVEGFSEGLHYELRPFNIRVKVIEPGIIKTNFYSSSMVDTKMETIPEYKQMVEKSYLKMTATEKSGSQPLVIAKLIYKAANDKSFRLRYHGGCNSGLILTMRKLLPDWLFFPILRGSTM